jgi:hypothetical protein
MTSEILIRHEEARCFLERRGEDYELIAVDDGSTDESSQLLNQLSREASSSQLRSAPIE